MVNAFEPKVLTVSQVNEYVKMLLDSEPLLADLYVKGEISNFTSHRSGHLYFTLKDETAAVKAVMFRSAAAKLKFVPQNGMKVLAKGRVSVLFGTGSTSYTASRLSLMASGRCIWRSSSLKTNWRPRDCLTNHARSRFPKYAARRNYNLTDRRCAARYDKHNAPAFPFAELVLFPSLVQGAEAPPQLIEGIKYR